VFPLISTHDRISEAPTGSEDERESFVFVLGSYLDDGVDIRCESCDRALAHYVKDGQIVRVVMECPDCQYRLQCDHEVPLDRSSIVANGDLPRMRGPRSLKTLETIGANVVSSLKCVS
jgi:hypothetical protein